MEDLDYHHNYFVYHGRRLFGAEKNAELDTQFQDIKTGFAAKANNGPFNGSYAFLDEEVAKFVTTWTASLKWHQAREQERQHAHDEYVRHMERKAQKQLEWAAKGEEAKLRQRQLNAQRAQQEAMLMRERLRAITNQESDVTAASRPSSSTSRWYLQ